jgi:hypothetical protein
LVDTVDRPRRSVVKYRTFINTAIAMLLASRQCVQILLLAFVLSHVAFGLHVATHAAGDTVDCVLCSSHAHTPALTAPDPFEFVAAPARVFDCESPAIMTPVNACSSFQPRGPPQLH